MNQVDVNSRFSCLHFIREIRSELGGVVTAVLDLSQAMAARGHRVVVATCDAKDVPEAWRRAEDRFPTVIELPASRLSKQLLSRRGQQDFRRMLPRFDVAHLHTPWDLCNLQLAKSLHKTGLPYVITAHGMLDHYSMQVKSLKKRAFLQLGGRRLFEQATTAHFTAEEERTQALHYVPAPPRVAVEPCLVDLSPFDRMPGPELAQRAFPEIPVDSPKALFLSRVHHKKGIDLLLRAAALLQSSHPQLQLLIAGPGEQRYVNELKGLAAELGLARRTHFLGMVRGETKLSLHQFADLFVLPTRQENFGLVLPEAMACGLPVVTTRGTDIWQELQQGGVRIVDGAPQPIADAIVELLGSEALRQSMAVQGKTYVREWLDANRLASRYEAMYRDAIACGGAACDDSRSSRTTQLAAS